MSERNDYYIEGKFEYLGYICVVVLQAKGHRCGYVGMTTSNRLYGHREDDVIVLKDLKKGDIISKYDGEYLDDLSLDIDVHGGVTFAGGGQNSDYPIKSNLWWWGFDCAHWDDLEDFETSKWVFRDSPEILRSLQCNEGLSKHYWFNMNKQVRTYDYVATECKKLAEQLKKFEI